METGIYEKLEIPDEDRLTSIRKEEAEYLYWFLKEQRIKSSLEIGFAYGCSTAYIISATRSTHIVIDPYQSNYKNIGLKNIKQLGLEKYLRFIEKPSHSALPELLTEGVKVDFIFIDGGHKFDEIFIDWYYADLLLKTNGHVFLDDSWLSSTKRVASFIRTNRNDFTEVPTPVENLVAFQKIATDERKWDHFVEF